MEWTIKDEDIKRYPHFDAVISPRDALKLVKNPDRISKHPFYPFLRYEKAYQPFRRDGGASKPEKKRRPIRYASRIDSLIFAYYRHLLSIPYEAALIKRGIAHCPIAYRRITVPGSKRGKCNIDFAAQAFEQVRALVPCCALAMDISQFFESIDHGRLRELWCRLLELKQLPPDHNAVFRAITRYADVDRTKAYEQLGYIGPIQTASEQNRIGYRVTPGAVPRKLCSNQDFRILICGNAGKHEDLVKRNPYPYGIPQGAPISDLLANLYLIDFDSVLETYVRSRGGAYYRYSDDILLIVPGTQEAGQAAHSFVSQAIIDTANNLKIKDTKTALVQFAPGPNGTLTALRVDRPADRRGLEYLGFRFDGTGVYIRDSTMSRLHRNTVRAARARARQIVARFKGHDLKYLLCKFNLPEFESRFSRVRDFHFALSHKRWTFRTYVKRSAQVFGSMPGSIFYKQLRRHRCFIRKTVVKELERTLARQRDR